MVPALVSAEGLEALATLSPRDEAGQRRVQTMLRRKVTAQHVDRPGWLHVFPVVPYALATLRIASSQIDMAWIEREMRSSLVIDVEEWGVEPQCEMRDDEREVLFLSSDDDGNHVHNPSANAQGVRDILQTKMKIHRLNHKLSCMVRAKTDDLEQNATSSKARDHITFRCGERSHSCCGGSLLMWWRVLLLRRCRLTCTEPLSKGGSLSSTPAW